MIVDNFQLSSGISNDSARFNCTGTVYPREADKMVMVILMNRPFK